MRKLVVAVALLAILLVVLDRVAVVGVQREIARQIEAKYDLAQTPSVQVKGIPFLTQAISGRYEEISIGIGKVEREGVQLERIDATLYGVTAPLSDLIQNAAATEIRADRVTGTVVISRQTLSAHARAASRSKEPATTNSASRATCPCSATRCRSPPT